MHAFYSRLSDFRKTNLQSEETPPRLKQLFKLYFLLMNAKGALEAEDLSAVHAQESSTPDDQNELLHQMWFLNASARYCLYVQSDINRASDLTSQNIQYAKKLFSETFPEEDKDKKSILFILALNVVRLSFYRKDLKICRLQLDALTSFFKAKTLIPADIFSKDLTDLLNVQGLKLLSILSGEDLNYFDLKLKLMESKLQKNLLESFRFNLEAQSTGVFLQDFDNGIQYTWTDVDKISKGITGLIKKEIRYVLVSTKQNIYFPATILACWMMDKTPVMVHESYTEYELQMMAKYFKNEEAQVLTDDMVVIEKYKSIFSHVTSLTKTDSESSAPPFPTSLKNMAIGLFSSGTSGPSKLCLFSHENLMEAARIEASNEPVFLKGIIANLRPHYTSAGLNTLWPHLIMGSQLVVSEKIRKTPITRFLNEMLLKTKPALLVLSPSYLLSMFQNSDEALRSNEKMNLYFGGSSLPENIIRSLRENNFIPSMRYGMTEVGHIISKKTYSGSGFDKADAGIPFKNVDVSLENGYLKINTKGVVSVIRDGEKETTITNGFLSADKATIQSDDSIILEGRDNRTISINGFRFHSQQVEDVLLSTGLILDCRVLGIKDENQQETLKAFILLKDLTCSNDSIKKELKKTAAEKLSHFKQPADYQFYTEWPAGPNGKIDFKKLV